MLPLLNAPIRSYFSFREERIVSLYEHALETQEKWFAYLVKNGAKTTFGKKFGLEVEMNYDAFKNSIPVQDYTSLAPYIERVIKGEENILWSTKIEYVAKSSGTTQGKSKFIPVSSESLQLNNFLAAKDSLTYYTEMFPDTEIFSGKGITLGGSFQQMNGDAAVQCGDISAILMKSMPAIGEFLKAPNKKILLNDNWNEKLKLIAQHTVDENITSISGVPSWILLILQELLSMTGKSDITQVWPNIEVFFHGGVDFTPYREEYQKLFPNQQVFFMNMYNASEGFFGFQDQRNSSDLLLLTDHGVFYEFIEYTTSNEVKKVVPLKEVELGKRYAILITTPAGLWRYTIGDTIEFTSLRPFRFRISGRTTQFINVFGEELIVGNADAALSIACAKTGAVLSEYTAAPVFLQSKEKKGAHQWVLEFRKEPENIEIFTQELDNALKSVNSDYEAKRTGNIMLSPPIITIVPKGTFLQWLASKKKLGGQHKIPRLNNERTVVDEVLALL